MLGALNEIEYDSRNQNSSILSAGLRSFLLWTLALPGTPWDGAKMPAPSLCTNCSEIADAGRLEEAFSRDGHLSPISAECGGLMAPGGKVPGPRHLWGLF